MPGWHQETRKLVAQGRLQVAGVIQEQHPDRCRLFMQWQEMDWPVLVDSYNLLEVGVVPLTLFIDEQGIVQGLASGRIPAGEALQGFLQRDPSSDKTPIHSEGTQATTIPGLGSEPLLEYFQARVQADPEDAKSHFRLGVAFRKRYDSPQGEAIDFNRAVEHWSRALDLDPNQYIWRRRLQQYGPRLEKPYPFYDWVGRARREIRARGEEPVRLDVEPKGAEVAAPSGSFEVAAESVSEPDPKGRIERDREGLIAAQVVVVPPRVEPGGVARVHIELRPVPELEAHWNNEADDLEVWIAPPPDWLTDRFLLQVPNPPEEVSTEARRLELEVRAPSVPGLARIPGYALFYVCEGVDGRCLYRRKDLSLEIEVTRGRDSQ